MDNSFQIRLSKVDSVRSNEKDKSVDLDLRGTFKKITDTNLISAVDLYKLFENERSLCTKHRIVLTINPFCTNVLFNACTEIVKDEGGNTQTPVFDLQGTEQNIIDAYGKKYNITRSDMIRNTEYSRESLDYAYYPGIDIFNNHILRNISSKIVNMYNSNNEMNSRLVFNTLSDYYRDYLGNINDFAPRKRLSTSVPSIIRRHLYIKDDIMSFDNLDAVNNNLSVENGWFGFKNTNTIDAKEIDGDKKLDINRVINNKENCEFVDMYPDRSLFLFTPKSNEKKKRLEYNWDIEITYPYKNFYSHPLVNDGILNTNSKNIFERKGLNAMLIKEVKYKTMPNGSMGLCFRTYIKHGLKAGDYFNLYYYINCSYGNNESEYMVCSNTCNVYRLGDDDNRNDEYYFSVSGINILNEIIGSVVLSEECGFYTEYVGIPSDQNSYTLCSGVFNTIPFFHKTEDDVFKYRHIKFYQYVLGVQTGTYDELNTFYEIPTVTTDKPDHIMVLGENGSALFYDRVLKFYDLSDNLQEDSDIISRINEILSNGQFRYRRVVSGIESEYYFRLFKKLPNFKYSMENITPDIASDEELFDSFVDLNAKDENGDMYKFDCEWYDLAFAHTIYNDQITQVTYTDDIDISDIRDNRGRPLTNIYATIVKKNCGYRKWYTSWDKDKDYGSDDVEYSHCFGKVTSGVPMLSDESDRNNFSRMKKLLFSDAKSINNVMADSLSLEAYIGKSDSVDGIKDDVFFGDVVDFNPVDAFETVLEDVHFRFNTGQREFVNNNGEFVMRGDELITDDFDIQSGDVNSQQNASESFYVQENVYPYDVIRPEGYYYKAHYEIKVRELGVKHQDTHYRLNVSECDVVETDEEDNFIRIRTRSNSKCFPGDIIYLCNDTISDWVETKVVYVVDDKTILCSEIENMDTNQIVEKVNSGEIKVRLKNPDIPNYAVRVGVNDFIWRDINKNGDSRNKLMKEYPFTNGAFYIDVPINFFLKRQDPEGINNLYYYNSSVNRFINPNGVIEKTRDIDYVVEGRMTC